MKILVTGGVGYIGSHLVEVLRQAGHIVRVLDIISPGDQGVNNPDYEFIQGSVADPTPVTQAVRDTEIVYNLAWSFRPENRAEEERREIQENLCGTLNLLETALGAGVQHFIFAGSAVVYGPTGPARVDEEHVCHPEQSTLGGPLYGITKLMCEKLCLVYQQRGLPTTVFRLHGVFDEAQHLQKMIRQAVAGEPVRVTRQAGGEYIHMEDALRALLFAMNNPQAYGEVFNLAGSHTYRDLELARYIVAASGSASQIEPVEDAMQGMISVSVDKLRRVLGYEPQRGEFLTGLVRQALCGEPGSR